MALLQYSSLVVLSCSMPHDKDEQLDNGLRCRILSTSDLEGLESDVWHIDQNFEAVK